MSGDATLVTSARAIAQGDRARVAGLLAGEPELARACLAVGATRRGDEEHFLDEINHHVYAGDTALHIAAAAYEPGLTRALVNAGAIVRAANRRAPSRFITLSTAYPVPPDGTRSRNGKQFYL